MKAIPRFLRRSFRNAMRVAMDEALQTNEVRRIRGWKLFLLPMLLHRPGRGGNIPEASWCNGLTIFVQVSGPNCCAPVHHAIQMRWWPSLKRRRQMPEDDVKGAQPEISVWCRWESCQQGVKRWRALTFALGMLRDPRKRPLSNPKIGRRNPEGHHGASGTISFRLGGEKVSRKLQDFSSREQPDHPG